MTFKVRKVALAGLAAASALALLAGCGQAPSSSSTTKAAASKFLPCMVSDSGGFDDHSFNQLGYEGLQEAAKSLNVKYNKAESKSENDFAPNIQSMVDANCKLVVTVGFLLADATKKAASANPDVDFAIIDDNSIKADNVKPIIFDTAQAAFLAGYLAAGYSKAGKLGTFGGSPYPTVTIFMDGFLQGVNYYNQQKGTSVQVIGWDGKDGLFTGGFEANDTAKADAQQLIDQGVDVILPVGGPIYQSAIAAIQDSGKDIAMVGVDADQYLTDTSVDPYILTSIQKKMDASSYDATTAAAKGDFDPTAYVGTLANGGVDIAPLHDFESKVDPALVTEVTALKQDID